MSPLDQVIAELEQEQKLLELTLVCLRGRRALREASAPDIVRIVGRPQPALLPPAVVERLRSETAKAAAKPSRPRHVARAKGTTPRDSTRTRATESPTPILAERSGRVARPAAGMGAGDVAAPLTARDQVLDGLKHGPLSVRALAETAGTSLTFARNQLQKLKAAGLVSCAGRTQKARWSLVSSPPGPTPRKSAVVNGVEFETVWNGAKDRARQAPSLVGSR